MKNASVRMLVSGLVLTSAVVGSSADAAPLGVTSPTLLSPAAQSGEVAYRRAARPVHRRYARRGYRGNAAGAAIVGGALGLIGAGIAAASQPDYGYGYPAYGYGYPAYGYGYGYPAYGYGYRGYGW